MSIRQDEHSQANPRGLWPCDPGDEQGLAGSHEGFSGCSRWPLLLARGRFHPQKEALAFETCNFLSSTRRASCAEELKLGEHWEHGLPFSCTEMFTLLDTELVELPCK